MMGGYGSGWHRGPRRATVGERCSLDVLRFNRDGLLAGLGLSWVTSWRRGDEVAASIGCARVSRPEGLAIELRYTWTPRDGTPEDLAYAVPIEQTPCTFGGARPWFRCPNTSCGRRCRFLYQHGGYYVCRICADLTYWTRQAHRNPSEEAQAAGVPYFGRQADERLLDWRRDPVLRTLYRLVRARNPRKVASLERRLERLQKLQNKDLAYFQRMAGMK